MQPSYRHYPRQGLDRRVASYDPSTGTPQNVLNDANDQRNRIVSDDVMIRNRDPRSPDSLSGSIVNDGFNFWSNEGTHDTPYDVPPHDAIPHESDSHPVDAAYNPHSSRLAPRHPYQQHHYHLSDQLPPRLDHQHPSNPRSASFSQQRRDFSSDSLPAPGQFSFSEADESVAKFNAPLPRSTFEEDFETNDDLVSFQALPERKPATDSDLNTIQSSLPPNSAASISNPALNLIIGNYDYSSSGMTLNKYEDQLRTSAALSVLQGREKDPRKLQDLFSNAAPGPKDHLRNNSASSTLSNTSTSSSATKNNNEQRFLRYAMSTQSTQSSLKPLNRWLMKNVLAWLDYHGFNESWKGTFKRNEISGNRFLELCNYDASSNIWKQFSARLDNDGHKNNVERFIILLRSELEALDSKPASYGSTSLNPADSDANMRAENRKSSSTLWAQSPSYNPTRPRPFSYIDPSNIKPGPGKEQTRDSSHSHKFFRLHHRTSSTESNRDSSSSATSLPTPNLYTHNQRPRTDESRPSMTNNPSRKSGLFSSLWKYGGDKAAGIVKQVQPSTGGQRHASNRKSTYGNPKKGAEQTTKPPINNRESNSSITKLQEPPVSPSSSLDTNLPRADDAILSPIEDVKLASEEDFKKDQIDARYYPNPKTDLVDESKLILVTKDNSTFKPLKIFIEDLEHPLSLRRKIAKAVELLEIGTLTYHLTDFDCLPGDSMPEEVLVMVLRQGFFCKIYLQQTAKSPGTATISSTSSDSKSFDTTGEINGGKIYPATPQYLLQDVRDKSVDYINFKEQDSWAHSREAERVRNLSSFNHPLKLSMPANRRTSAAALQRNITPLNPQAAQKANLEVIPDKTASRSLSNEARDIEVEKRRQPSAERRDDQTSVNSRSARSRSASTISNTKDEKSSNMSSKSVRSNKLRDESTSRVLSAGLDFVARRKAPPPPTSKGTNSQRATTESSPVLSHQSDDSYVSMSSEKKFSRKKKSAKKTQEDSNAFVENDISFNDAPAFSPATPSDTSKDKVSDSDDDSFFMKPVRSKTSLGECDHDLVSKGGDDSIDDGKRDDDDDEDDFFVKPIAKKRDPPIQKMNVRPPVEEVYKNLEKYFPNTNLDKPIIDASPESPVVQKGTQPAYMFPIKREKSIARTFSNANISPGMPPTDPEDEPLQAGEGHKLRRRMKTIRIVANEARIKRLASQKAGLNATSSHNAAKGDTSGSGSHLRRANTKLWGQKVVEVTSAEIEKGFVSRLRNNTNGQFEEFAWIKGELIGRGSFGAVYLALNVTTGEMLAVKQVVVSDGASADCEGLDALHKEVETMKDLDHLNIVQYLGFEQKKNTYSLFLEYVAGGSISSCLRTLGRFDELLVRFIIRQVLEGLRYLHSNGILHRDLKADNLLLETDGTCKISDFGISKKSQDIYSNNAEMSMQGTVFWMAPEVIHSIVADKKQGYSAKVDIWSLGCVVLEMLAGKRPWSNEAVISAIYKIGKTKLAPPIPNDISEDAKDFVHQCFTIDSAKRPTAEKLLEHRFMKVEESFSFEETRLSEVIKFNSRRVYST